jgi:general secretion pathway protein J
VRQRGFTLLELLVALAVLALLGALGYRGLDSVLDAESRLQAESRRWDDVSLLFSQLSEDLAMAVERSARDDADRASPALLLRDAGGDAASADDAQLMVMRLGIGEGAATQSAPRRVGYRLRDGALEYLVWPAPDSAPGAVPTSYAVLENVADLQLQALDFDGRWTTAWPAGRAASALPRAVTVRIVLAGGEEISRILPVR